jgi:hypothetical protein
MRAVLRHHTYSPYSGHCAMVYHGYDDFHVQVQSYYSTYATH